MSRVKRTNAEHRPRPIVVERKAVELLDGDAEPRRPLFDVWLELRSAFRGSPPSSRRMRGVS